MKTTPSIAAVLVLGSLVGIPARAAEDVPFSAELTGVFSHNEQQFNIDDLDGVATQLGPVTGTARYFVQAFHAEGTMVLDSGHGDRIVIDYEIDRVEPGFWAGTYTVSEESTGIFAGASGNGVMALAFFPDLPHAYDLVLDGTISF